MAASSPRAVLMALVSQASLRGVLVPGALMYSLSSPRSRRPPPGPSSRRRRPWPSGWGAVMLGVAGDAVAAQLAVNLGPAGHGVLVLLQHQGPGALAHNERCGGRRRACRRWRGPPWWERAFMLLKPATPMGMMAASAPPVSTASR